MHKDVDLAGVGLVEGVDICPSDPALGGVGQGAPVVVKVRSSRFSCLAYFLRGEVGLEEDLVSSVSRFESSGRLPGSLFHSARRARTHHWKQDILGARVPQALLLDQLHVHRRAGAHEEVDVFDAALADLKLRRGPSTISAMRWSGSGFGPECHGAGWMR